MLRLLSLKAAKVFRCSSLVNLFVSKQDYTKTTGLISMEGVAWAKGEHITFWSGSDSWGGSTNVVSLSLTLQDGLDGGLHSPSTLLVNLPTCCVCVSSRMKRLWIKGQGQEIIVIF